MDSNELREACEMAGLQWDEHTRSWERQTPTHWLIDEHHPALHAYIADLLTQRVEIIEYTVEERDTTRVSYKYECEVLDIHPRTHDGIGNTPAEAIIRAFMAALKRNP